MGVHHAILGAVSTLACLGYSAEEIEPMVTEWMSPVTEPYPREIPDAIEKVFGDGDPRLAEHFEGSRSAWPESDFSKAIALTRENGNPEECELLLRLTEASPIDTESKNFRLSTDEWLELFYQDEDYLCIGENFFDREVKLRSQWQGYLRYAHYISPNPFRSDIWGRRNDNVLERRFLVTEMDINEAHKMVLKSYGLNSFDVQARVILYLKDLGKLKLRSVVWSGRKSLHSLWEADNDESVNLAFMREAVALGVEKAGYTLSQFCRIYNPKENQPLFYLDV